VGLLGACGIMANAQQGAQWGYEGKLGPLNWGKLDPAYRTCSDGKAQSPIDIRARAVTKLCDPSSFTT